MNFKISLDNGAGELDAVVVQDINEISRACIRLVRAADLQPGDTIKITETNDPVTAPQS